MTEYEYQRHYYHLDNEPRDDDLLWKNASKHREIVTRVAAQATQKQGGKLALLGAGLCNDVDLKQLLQTYSEIHLIDIDGDACWKGAEYQGVSNDDRIKIQGRVDVTGVASRLNDCRERTPSDSEIETIIQELLDFKLADWSEYFDAAISLCLLSQLNQYAIECIGEDHAKLVDLLIAMRVGHTRVLADLCRKYGWGVIIYDFVSSATLSGLDGFEGDDLQAVLTGAISQNNFFHGMNPQMIQHTLLNDPRIKSRINSVGSSIPWVWNMTKRHYAVSAVKFQKVRPN